MENLKFGEVIEQIRNGKKVSRVGWNGKGLYIQLQIPDEKSFMTRPYIYITSPSGSTKQYGDDPSEHRIPWLPSNTDIFAEDWYILKEW